jgi:hypothetical protein
MFAFGTRTMRDYDTREDYPVKALVDCVEIQPHLAADLQASGLYKRVYVQNFLSLTPETTGLYDRVVMNPPFDRQRDIDHVMHALKILEAGGLSPGHYVGWDGVSEHHKVKGLPPTQGEQEGTHQSPPGRLLLPLLALTSTRLWFISGMMGAHLVGIVGASWRRSTTRRHSAPLAAQTPGTPTR